MKVKPSKVTYRIHQLRFIDVEVSEEKGFDMPETLKECISMSNEIQGNPTLYVTNINWAHGFFQSSMDMASNCKKYTVNSGLTTKI